MVEQATVVSDYGKEIQAVWLKMGEEDFGEAARVCAVFRAQFGDDEDKFDTTYLAEPSNSPVNVARRKLWTHYAHIFSLVEMCSIFHHVNPEVFAFMIAKANDVGCIRVYLNTAHRMTGLKTNGVPTNHASVGRFFNMIISLYEESLSMK